MKNGLRFVRLNDDGRTMKGEGQHREKQHWQGRRDVEMPSVGSEEQGQMVEDVDAKEIPRGERQALIVPGVNCKTQACADHSTTSVNAPSLQQHRYCRLGLTLAKRSPASSVS